ncbi:MAG: hypothetical protein QM674_07115 [Burkholderiaceae bacterium]
MSAPPMDRWDPASPGDAAAWLANVAAPWWIAGGWAIDMFLDRETRSHKDLDVGILRRDVGEVLGSIPGFEVFEAKDGGLTRLSGAAPRAEDERDFEAVAPHLAGDARHWLRQSLLRTLPSHPWIGMLDR